MQNVNSLKIAIIAALFRRDHAHGFQAQNQAIKILMEHVFQIINLKLVQILLAICLCAKIIFKYVK